MTEPRQPTLQEAIDAIQEHRAEARILRRAVERQNTFLKVVIVVGVLAITLVAGLAVDNRVTNAKLQRVVAQNQADIAENIRTNNLLLCPAFGGLISGPAPTTPRGEWSLKVFTDLFVKYGCTAADIPKLPDESGH